MNLIYKYKKYLLSFLAVLMIASFDHYLSSITHEFNGIATFNKGKAISEFAKELTKVKLSSQKKSVLIKKFSTAMNDVLRDESRKRRIAIVSPNMIIAGSFDVTDELLPIIAKRIKTVIQYGSKT